MFNGINWKTLLNNPEEWHALVIGFSEVLCPWPAQNRLTGEALNKLLSEYHYYTAGRAAGFPVLLLILIGMAKLVKEGLL